MTAGLKRLQGQFLVEQPNPDFEKFVGKFKLKGYPTSKPLLRKNLVLRDSKIVNCKWAIGCVIYAGEETKTRLNTMASKNKTSRIEQLVNKFVVVILIILFLIVLFSSMASTFMGTNEQVEEEDNFLEHFVVFTLLYNNIVPISLFVVMDIVRIL